MLMKEWSKRKVRLILNKAPWLKRRLRKTINCVRSRRAYWRRHREIPRLLDKYGVKLIGSDGTRHVIFIVVDCLRKDHMSLYGYERETTPFLKSLAQDAAVFENAITASPWTHSSVASMLTGLYPHNHGAVHSQNPRNFDKEYPNNVRQDILALPEVLVASEFQSLFVSAISAAALPTVGWFENSSVFWGGVDKHQQTVLKWLIKNKEKSSFVYFQLADLHAPINTPELYKDVFGRIADIPKLNTWQFREDAQLGDPAFERYRENRTKLYDSALRFVDDRIAKFFEDLKEARLLDSCLIFITSDHGEEFWDHMHLERRLFYDPRGFHGVGHGHNLFQEIINVPLICIGPGMTAGSYSHNVSLVDLAPTVLELCGIEHKLVLDGCNLFDCRKKRLIFSEGVAYGYEKKAVLKNNWKLIHSEGDAVSLLYDLSKDSKEINDLSKIKIQELGNLKVTLPRTQRDGETLKVGREIREQLKNLGYM